jgi:hypothetical protein
MNAMLDQLWARLNVGAADALCELLLTGSLFAAAMAVAGPAVAELKRRSKAPPREPAPRYLWVE